MYLDGMGSYLIADELNSRGIKSPYGGIWHDGTILKMLHNEKYKGCTLMQKTYGEDLLSGKRKKNRGEIKQYYYEDTHPAIVSKELYEKVQLQLNAK